MIQPRHILNAREYIICTAGNSLFCISTETGSFVELEVGSIVRSLAFTQSTPEVDMVLSNFADENTAAANSSDLNGAEAGSHTQSTNQELLKDKSVIAHTSQDTTKSLRYYHCSLLLAAVTDTKQLIVWQCVNGKFTKITQTLATKRANTVLFSPDCTSLLIGDKQGDVLIYAFVQNSKVGFQTPKLLLGHVSILTALTWSHDQKSLVSADRDEKVRVNKYPGSFVIEWFLTGHEEFVTKLCLLPSSSSMSGTGSSNVEKIEIATENEHCLVSGGGDAFLFVWNYKSGQLLQKVAMFGEITGVLSFESTCITSISIDATSCLMAVTLEKQSMILIYTVADALISFVRRIEVEKEVLEAAFDDLGRLWMTLLKGVKCIDISKSETELFEISSMTDAINGIVYDAGCVVDNGDLYELGKLRKWSQWKPAPKRPAEEVHLHQMAKLESHKKKRNLRKKAKISSATADE